MTALRCGNVIRNNGQDTVYDSINLAKKASRKLQPRLGDGSVKVVSKLKPLKGERNE